MTAEKNATTEAPKRGRPAGSKNRPKAVEQSSGDAIVGEVIEPSEAPVTALVVSDEPTAITTAKQEKRLATIASNIQKEFGKGIDAQFAIGRLLNEARTILPSNQDFGRWFDSQEFTFSQPTAYRLQQAAEREEEVRAFIASSGKQGRDIGVTSAVKELTAGPKATQELKDVGKRVRDLLADPTVSNGFEQFRAAADSIDLTQFSVEELGEFATLIQNLVAAYGVERKRRTA